MLQSESPQPVSSDAVGWCAAVNATCIALYDLDVIWYNSCGFWLEPARTHRRGDDCLDGGLCGVGFA